MTTIESSDAAGSDGDRACARPNCKEIGMFDLGSCSLFGEVTYLETRLEDAQDGIARYHPDNAAVVKNWHLIEYLLPACVPER